MGEGDQNLWKTKFSAVELFYILSLLWVRKSASDLDLSASYTISIFWFLKFQKKGLPT